MSHHHTHMRHSQTQHRSGDAVICDYVRPYMCDIRPYMCDIRPYTCDIRPYIVQPFWNARLRRLCSDMWLCMCVTNSSTNSFVMDIGPVPFVIWTHTRPSITITHMSHHHTHMSHHHTHVTSSYTALYHYHSYKAVYHSYKALYESFETHYHGGPAKALYCAAFFETQHCSSSSLQWLCMCVTNSSTNSSLWI